MSRGVETKSLLDSWNSFDFMKVDQNLDLIASRAFNAVYSLRENGTNLKGGYPFLKWSPRGKGYGWSLYLKGAEETVLSSVRWDDREGFEKLAQSMRDVDTLWAQLALLDPICSGKLNNVIRTESSAEDKYIDSIIGDSRD